MAYLLIPIGLFVKALTHKIYLPYLAEIPFYVYLLFFSFVFYKEGIKKTIYNEINSLNKNVVYCSLIFLILQLIAMFQSYIDIGNNVLNRNLIAEYAKIAIIFACMFMHYYFVKLIVKNETDIRKFIFGTGIALIMLLCVSYLQFFYMFFPKYFAPIVSFIGKYFEARSDRDWYDLGSYVQTMHRINGFNSESSYLAAQLLILFVPFVLSAIKNKTDIFKINSKKFPLIWYYFLLLLIIFILFFAKTTTGLISIAIIIVSLWVNLSKINKLITAIMGPAVMLGGYFLVIHNTFFRNTLMVSVFSKLQGGSSVQNRFGGTLSLIYTWITHFFTGIGWDFNNYYVFKFLPQWSTHNLEYRLIFLPRGQYPILSVVFGFLAMFGTISFIFVIFYFYKLLRDLRILRSKNIDQINKELIVFIVDAAHYFFIFYLISSLFIFSWADSIYFIMIFFFVVTRKIYMKNIEECYE